MMQTLTTITTTGCRVMIKDYEDDVDDIDDDNDDDTDDNDHGCRVMMVFLWNPAGGRAVGGKKDNVVNILITGPIFITSFIPDRRKTSSTSSSLRLLET